MNKVRAKVFEEGKRFNRYMVECEFQFLNRIFCHFLVLIDTWWNVNVFLLSFVTPAIVVLIDTWWNVN